MDITPSNYHSLDAKRANMSNSQWKSWLACGAATKAQLAGEYTPETTEAMLVGSFVDCALTTPDLFEAWKTDHAEHISLKKGGLKAPFELGLAMIDRVQKDPIFAQIKAKAKSQVVLKGTINNQPWLYMADWIMDASDGPVLLDLKTTASFDDQWAECSGRNIKVPWYDAWGYWRQLAVGRDIYYQNYGIMPTCGIVAVTKQDPPSIGVWVMEDVYRFEAEIRRIEELTGLVMAQKQGLVPPSACGACPYCREKSSLSAEKLAVSARPYTE